MTNKAPYVIPLLLALATGVVIGRYHSRASAATLSLPLYYVDPMHPAYRSSKPGKAPDCGMDLVAVYPEDAAQYATARADSGEPGFFIAPAAQQLYGIQVTPAEAGRGLEHLQAFGRIAADERRIYRVNLGTDGYVKETHQDAVGDHVNKDQHLATIYSPDFLSVAGGYLSANERTPSTSNGMAKTNAAPTANAASAQARADRLRNLGMSDSQIDEMSETRKIPEDIYVVSPVAGFIIARTISPGLRFERHTDLYTIADLSHIWILTQVSNRDALTLHPGMWAQVTMPDTGKTFRARVSSALPEIDPESNTLTLRLEADNPGFSLRPLMSVNVEFPIQHTAQVMIPADSLLVEGVRKRVYVQSAFDRFTLREVETGARLDNRIQVLKGLAAGERVVSGNTFLVDSESRLHDRRPPPPFLAPQAASSAANTSLFRTADR